MKIATLISYTDYIFSSEETISIRELLSVSIFLAEKGGQELVKIYNSGSLNTAEKTGKSDLVTKGIFSYLENAIFELSKINRPTKFS